MPLLTLQHVSLAYGHVPLLDQVDLNVDAGDKIALIGRNGTGKSSLLRVVAGDARPDDGEVWRKPGLASRMSRRSPRLRPGRPCSRPQRKAWAPRARC
jgi:ABC transport system ATP-binding/permease protein